MPRTKANSAVVVTRARPNEQDGQSSPQPKGKEVWKPTKAAPRVWNVGDHFVYPGFGVGKVTELRDKIVGNVTIKFIIGTLVGNGSELQVPLSSPVIRPVMSDDDVAAVLLTLARRVDPPSGQHWSKRYHELMAELREASPTAIAGVVQTLWAAKRDKESRGEKLSFSEGELLSKAVRMLTEEFGVTKALDERAARDLISNTLPL